MTRTITLKLADNTTATHCGSCPQYTWRDGWFCFVYGRLPWEAPLGARRASACVENENALIDAEIDAIKRGIAIAFTSFDRVQLTERAIRELEARKVKL